MKFLNIDIIIRLLFPVRTCIRAIIRGHVVKAVQVSTRTFLIWIEDIVEEVERVSPLLMYPPRRMAKVEPRTEGFGRLLLLDKAIRAHGRNFKTLAGFARVICHRWR